MFCDMDVSCVSPLLLMRLFSMAQGAMLLSSLLLLLVLLLMVVLWLLLPLPLVELKTATLHWEMPTLKC